MSEKLDYQIGDNTGFSFEHAQSEIVLGGIGSNAYVCRITGTNQTYIWERDFLIKDLTNVPYNRTEGIIFWYLDGPGVYEYNHFTTHNKYEKRGYVVVDEKGVGGINEKKIMYWLKHTNKLRRSRNEKTG